MDREKPVMGDLSETAFVELDKQQVEAVSGGMRDIGAFFACQALRAAWNIYNAR